jgi:hypothetical protein
LKEVIEMFGEFGFPESEVRQSLGAGDSAHNAFEGLKVRLELRWADMNQELGTERLKALKPLYTTLMGLKMTGRKTKKEMAAKRRAKAKAVAADVMEQLEERKRRNMERFMESVGEKLRAKDLDEDAKARVRAMGLGDLLDEE